jgi:hypothetical protein
MDQANLRGPCGTRRWALPSTAGCSERCLQAKKTYDAVEPNGPWGLFI